MMDTTGGRPPMFPLLGLLLALVFLTPTVDADQVVNFAEGRALVVKSAEKRGDWYHLILEGGGELGIPASRVASVEEYEAPPPGVVRSSAPNQAAASTPVEAPPPAQNFQRSDGARRSDVDSEEAVDGMARNPAGPPPGSNTGTDVGPASVGDWRTKTRGGALREGAQSVGGGGRSGRAGRRLGYHPRKPPKGNN